MEDAKLRYNVQYPEHFFQQRYRQPILKYDNHQEGVAQTSYAAYKIYSVGPKLN
jgi:hypothetical protein